MCDACGKERAAVKRSKTGAKVLLYCCFTAALLLLYCCFTAPLQQVCKECFYALFEQEIHDTIVNEKMFKRGEKVCVLCVCVCPHAPIYPDTTMSHI
jgi:hypothetical protein